MLRERPWSLSSIALVGGLLAACGADEGSSCSPTEPGCATSAPPLLVSKVSPADGARHVDLSPTVTITFSAPVEPASVTSNSITVGTTSGTLSVNGATVTFTPLAPLAAGAGYQVRVQGVRGQDGAGMADVFTSSFTTRSTPVCTTCPATAFSRADVEAQGKVVETEEGFTVDGSLSLKVGGRRITFLGADVDVRFDPSGRLRSISGKVEIPSPHERIAFADPVRADVGLFTGRFLNEQRDLGILLKDDTDYFVFDFQTALKLSIATGQTGGGATKPVVVRAPIGGRVLMVMDYRDPMYFVYGEHDLLGAAGTGWSLNDRIPFVPKLAVAGLGKFDGGTTRVGTIPVFKILSVRGQMVDNEYTELHLSQKDPFASNLRSGYQAGFNGEVSLDLFLKDIVGLDIKLASASGGVRAEASSQAGFSGYAFARGATSRDFSWWPTFIPARPATELDAQARIESSGRFQVFLRGEYGWDFPAGRQSMAGSFELTDKAMTLSGAIRDGAANLNLTGVVTAPSTTVFIQPPPALLQQIHDDVNKQVLPRIKDAQTAWGNLKKATADYQFELSLRGIRKLIPGIVDVAKQALTDGIASALRPHEGTLYYGILKRIVDDHARPYYDRLNSVKAAALESRDDAATRAALEAALRTLAANKIFTMSYTHYVFGIQVAKVSVSRRIMSDAQADLLIQAANNVKYIPAASNVMISMQQIYDRIPDRAIFEQVRDDIKDGVVVMARIEELGLVISHGGQRTFKLYAVIGGKRYEIGSMEALTVAGLVAKLPAVMIDALRRN